MSKQSEKVSCRLPYEDRIRVKQAATATNRSTSEFVRDALMREVAVSECANENLEDKENEK